MINRKILAVLLTLAIVGAFLVPGTALATNPVQPAADWPLQLVGATTINITQAEFEAMAAATPSNTYVDSSGNTWKGVAMWRLIALVDDGDPNTFNASLVGTYTIQMTGINLNGSLFVKPIAPPYTSFAFQSPTEDLFVANKVMLSGTTEWIDLPYTKPGDATRLWYPLMDTGSGIGVGNMRVAALVKIELLNLPVTSVSVSPSSQAVANGASFTVDMAINTDTASRGWQMNVSFDASKLIANSVTEGTFLSAYAAANPPGGTITPGVATIDNVDGTITIPGWAISGAGTGGPTGMGTLCTISFTAKAAIDDFASITPTDVVVSDVNGTAIPGVTVTGGTVAIGDVPMPDLVVSALSAAKVDDTTYTITYTVTNQGNDAAAASTTSIVIDAGTPIAVVCPALAAGASDTQTTAAQTLTSGSDTIVATADSAGVVSESNESNNSRTIIYATAGDAGDTVIDGNIAAKLVLTAPPDIDPWNLVQGANSVSGPANVKCNSDWQLQVNDQNATTGHMTKWMLSSGYDLGTNLTDALNVSCQSSKVLSATPQTIATGTPAGQSGDSGQGLTIGFAQYVYYADPVLTGGYSYHIVITFTASVTI